MTTIDFLDTVEPFTEMTDEQLSALSDSADLLEFKKGDRLFLQADPAAYLWIVIEGSIELRSEGPASAASGQVSFLSATHAFGWTCFVPPYKYQLSGYCASRRSRVLRFAKDHLEKLFESHPEIGFEMMQYTLTSVGTQFQELEDELARHRGHEIMGRW